MKAELQRGEFATALRGWRNHRRVSQLELALSAGTTQRHISFLESGRSQPGRGMALRLAEALQVPLRDRNALLLAAGYAPAYRETRFDDPELDPVRSALERILEGHMPCPAVIVDRQGDLVVSNEAFWTLTEEVAPRLREQPVNVPRLFLDPDGMAPRIINLELWCWHVIEAIRREAIRNGNERLTALVEELESLAPDRPKAAAPDYLGFAVPLRLRTDRGELRLMTTLTHFGTAVDVTVAELRMEAFLPADRDSAAILAELSGRSTA
jgi:transcriptional regulator with XRE-family HTH domain